jgi:hypothetical protein
VIRFSAALVAVAIGVLMGGIATSKLVLVYIAIAVSAVALVALATGVMLKREELFGERQGRASAQAGASPVLPGQPGESHDQRPNGLMPPPPVQGAAAGPGTAFAGRAPAASAQPGMPWAAPAAADAWSSPAAPTAAVPAMWQAPPVPAGATASDWGASAGSESAVAGGPVAQGSATSPRAWDTPAPSVFVPRSTDTPAAGPGDGAGSGSPNWFNPAERPVSAGAAAPGSGDGWSWSDRGIAVPSDTETQPEDAAASAASAVDEDWPARYSWLDEEPEETGEGDDDKQAAADDKQAAAVAVIAGEPALPGDATVPADVVTPEDTGSSEDAEAPAAPVTLRLVRDPAPAAEVADAAEATQAAEALETAGSAGTAEVPGEREREPETELPATEADGHSPEADLVTVVHGVPRFHQEDCVLIRFMPEGDTQKMPVAEAQAAGCTPCAACQPEG